jgi:hypothetical protein
MDSCQRFRARHVATCSVGTFVQVKGHSHGGFSTKIHLSADGRCRVLTPCQHGDTPQIRRVLEAIRIPRPGPGRPRTRRGSLAADKAYSSRTNTPEQIRHTRDLLTRPDDTISSIARLLGVSRSMIYKHVPELKPSSLQQIETGDARTSPPELNSHPTGGHLP